MSKSLSKDDYLKKMYGGGKPKATKKAGSAAPSKGLAIIDEDVNWKSTQPKKEAKKIEPITIVDMTKRGPAGDAAEDKDELPLFVKIERNDGSGWASVDEPKRQSPSPPRRARADSPDQSPKRAGSGGRSDSPDQSPKRRSRADSPDQELPRRGGRSDSPDQSPPRRGGKAQSSSSAAAAGGDLSPPRKRPADANADLSPPRKRERPSPPRQQQRHDSPDGRDRGRGKERDRDRDLSPVRVKKEKPDRDMDISPPRKADKDRDKSRDKSREKEKDKPKAAPRETGLLRASDFAAKHQQEADKKAAQLKAMSSGDSGKDAETIIRDKRGRRLTQMEAMVAQQKGNFKAEDEKQMEWGKGLAQNKKGEAHKDELAYARAAPFARTADDERMNEMLRDRERWGDPMLELQRKNKAKREAEEIKRRTAAEMEAAEKGEKADHEVDEEEEAEARAKEMNTGVKKFDPNRKPMPRPVYKGAPWPNRFGILPGYRWDGQDRSINWEAKLFKAANERAARETEAFMWSSSDM